MFHIEAMYILLFNGNESINVCFAFNRSFFFFTLNCAPFRFVTSYDFRFLLKFIMLSEKKKELPRGEQPLIKHCESRKLLNRLSPENKKNILMNWRGCTMMQILANASINMH